MGKRHFILWELVLLLRWIPIHTTVMMGFAQFLKSIFSARVHMSSKRRLCSKIELGERVQSVLKSQCKPMDMETKKS